MSLKNISFLFFFTFCAQYLIGQNGWTQDKGKYYTQANIAHFSSNKFYGTEGNLFDGGSDFKSTALHVYGEYGISSRLTSTLNLPFIFHRFSTTETVSSLGSIDLGLKYRLLKNFPLSIQADFSIPTTDGIQFAQSKVANQLGTFDEINLPTSDGEFNIWTTLAASKSTQNGNTFFGLFGAVNFRTESFSNQLKIGGEVGHLFFDKLYLIGKVNILDRIGDGESSGTASFLFGEGTSYTSFNFTTMFKLNERLMLLGSLSNVSGTFVKRRNVYSGTSFSIGVALKN